MNFETQQSKTEQKVEIAELANFDMEYFKQIEGQDGWIAIGQDICSNQQYFTVKDTNNENLGIIGVYDTDTDKNISHTVVDPKFRGQRLAGKFKDLLMDKLNLDFLTLTIDLDNESSLKAAEKLSGVKRISDPGYEKEYHKAKFIYKRK